MSTVTLAGRKRGLELAELVRVATDPTVKVECDEDALADVRACAAHVSELGSSDKPVYGITTGFGVFKGIAIPHDYAGRNLRAEMQRNLLLSHAVGVGESTDRDDPSNYFPADVVRAALLLRLNTFLQGYSGVRPELVDRVKGLLNDGIIPLVPIRGSVGSSGDLCPLAHLFCVLLGHGRYYEVHNSADIARTVHEYKDASKLEHLHLAPSTKEGLALTNGAAFSAAILAMCVDRATSLANTADIAAALTLEAVCGCTRALDEKIHLVRRMKGQIDCAANLRNLVEGSKLRDKTTEVQDAYSLRCAPVVHGASRDAIAYARMVVEREINAVTDNPLFFPGSDPCDAPASRDGRDPDKDYESYSAGNFHGQPIGLAADFLAIAVSEFANISERRIQMLLDKNHNRNLPSNLISMRGLNSGFMLAQYCAAALVSENKVLAHPASVDSIPTSANAEDHVAMATHAARKLRTVLGNAEAVIGIELIAAAQAIEWRTAMPDYHDPNPPSTGKHTDPDLRSAFEEAAQFQNRVPAEKEAIIGMLGCGSRAAYLHLRFNSDAQKRIAPMFQDRMLDEDIRRARQLVSDGSLVNAVNRGIGDPLRDIPALRD